MFARLVRHAALPRCCLRRRHRQYDLPHRSVATLAIVDDLLRRYDFARSAGDCSNCQQFCHQQNRYFSSSNVNIVNNNSSNNSSNNTNDNSAAANEKAKADDAVLRTPSTNHYSVVRTVLQSATSSNSAPSTATASTTTTTTTTTNAVDETQLSPLDRAMLSWLRDRDTSQADAFFEQALRQRDAPSASLAKSQYAMYICEVDEAIDDASELVLQTLEELDELVDVGVDSRTRAIVHWNAATFYHRSFEDWDAATEQYAATCALLPNDADALCAAATMFISRGAGRSDYETALQRLNAILRRHPNHVMTLGWAAFVQENYFRNFARASELYEQAIALAPTNAYINRLFGLFLTDKLNDTVRAQKHMNFTAVGTLRRKRLQPHERRK